MQFSKYASFCAHGKVRGGTIAQQSDYRACALDIVSTPSWSGVVSLSRRNLSVRTHGGMHLYDGRPAQKSDEMTCMVNEFDQGASRYMIGTTSRYVVEANLGTGEWRRLECNLGDAGTTVIKRHSRPGSYILASGDGMVRVLDARAGYAVKKAVKLHQGAIKCMDVSANTVITCGLLGEQSNGKRDPLAKVLDLRMMRQLPPVQCAAPPAYVQFMPRFPNMAVMASASGSIRFHDVRSDGIGDEYYTMEGLSGAHLTCMDVSTSGEIVAFGDNVRRRARGAKWPMECRRLSTKISPWRWRRLCESRPIQPVDSSRPHSLFLLLPSMGPRCSRRSTC